MCIHRQGSLKISGQKAQPQITERIDNALKVNHLVRENRALHEKLERRGKAGDLLGQSEAMGRIFFLVVNSTAEYPSLGELVRHLVTQVGAISRLPLAVVALDVNGPRAKIEPQLKALGITTLTASGPEGD